MPESPATASSPNRPLRLVPAQIVPDSGAGESASTESVGGNRATMPAVNPTKMRLLDQVREAIRARHVSASTQN